jgi:hypothetical protein
MWLTTVPMALASTVASSTTPWVRSRDAIGWCLGAAGSVVLGLIVLGHFDGELGRSCNNKSWSCVRYYLSSRSRRQPNG